MNDCLFEKFKKEVNNSNLPIFGQLKWELAPYNESTPNRLVLLGYQPFSIKIVGTGHFYNLDGTQDKGQLVDAYEYNGRYYVDGTALNGVVDGDVLIVINKYGIDRITASVTAMMFKSGSEFDVSFLPLLDKLQLQNNNNVRFNIEDIGEGSKDVTEITAPYDSLIYGTIEKFVENLLAQGRNSGSCNVGLYSSQVTLHGQAFFTDYDDRQELLTITFGNNSATLTWKSSTIATYNGTTWSYS